MPWARDNLTDTKRREIARTLFRVTQERGDILTGHCPLDGHRDERPSFVYDAAKDSWTCYSHPSGSDHGDLVNLWARVKGLSNAEGFKAFREAFGDGPSGKRDGAGRKGRGSGKREPQNGGDRRARKGAVVPAEELAKLPPLPEEWAGRLAEARGWTRAIMADMDLRLWRVPGKGQVFDRVGIPIRDASGQVVDVRGYMPGAAEGKMIHFFHYDGGVKTTYGSPPHLWPSPDRWRAEERLWLMEGEPDCLLALSLGLNAATVTGGAGTWRDEWDAFFRGRDVVVCYDADAAGRKGASRVAPRLAKVARRVRVVPWPEDMEGQDFTDWVMKHGRGLMELDDLVESAPEVSAIALAPAPASEAEEDEEAFIRSCFGYSAVDDKTAYRSLLLVRALLERQQLLTDRASEVTYAYNGQVWRPLVRAEVERIIIEALGVGSGRNRIAEAVGMLKAETIMPEGEEFNHRPELLCCTNGMAALDTWETLPHDPAYRATYQFPWAFQPDRPPDCPEWKAALTRTLPDPETRRELQQFFGYCLWRAYPWHKVLWLVGAGSNGKSVVLHVLQRMVGLERTANVNIKDLEKPFSRATLHTRSINVFEEASADFFSTDYFKSLSDGGRVQAEHKFGHPFEFNNMCKLAFSMNELPTVRDKTDGFYRRLLPIVFEHKFTSKDKDPFLKAKLEAELPGIFHWALVGLAELRGQGDFIHCRATREALQRYKMENDPLKWFIEDRCLLDPEAVMTKEDLFSVYRKWCRETEQGRTLAHNKFFAALKRSLGNQINTEYRPAGSGTTRPPRQVQGLALADPMGM